MNFAELVTRQGRAIVFITLLLCVAGLYAAWTTPISIFPRTDFPRIVILVDNGVVPTPQMLVSVTRPIEEAMNGIPGIVTIKSNTSRGSAEVNLYFDWKVDIYQSLQLVQSRLSQLTSTLPATASYRADRLTFAVFPILGYSLTAPNRDLASMREIASYTIGPRLTRLPGVAKINVVGGKVREFHVEVDGDKLYARGLSLAQVVTAINEANVIVSPGLLDENHQLELALVSGQITEPEQLNSVVVGLVNNSPVHLGEVATIKQGIKPEFIIVTADGKPAVLINVLRQPDANTITVADEIKNELNIIQKSLPADITITPFYDQSLLVRASITSVRDSIIIGLLLSALIMFLFLRNWGTTLVATMVIPVTVLITFLAMKVIGLSFDLMTLGGVAAAIGLVIDDAIVVVENIYAHLATGQNRREAIILAVNEIAIPIVGSTLTPVVVFLPLSLLEGVTGVFFRSLALTMVVALLTSLVLALTFTPTLAQSFISVRALDEAEVPKGLFSRIKRIFASRSGHHEGRILIAVKSKYQTILRFSLAHRFLTLVGCLLIMGIAALSYHFIGSEFLPAFDEGAFVLDYIAPPGTSLAETDRILRHVEAILKETPEIDSYSRRTGAQLGLSITEPNTGDFLVKLKADHVRSLDQVTDEVRDKIQTSEPILQVEFAGILGDLIGDLTSSPSPIEIKLFSEDTAALHKKAQEVAEAIKDVPGVVDILNGIVVSGPVVTFQVDPTRAAQLGVTANDIATAVTTAVSGDVASTILKNSRLINVRVLLPLTDRNSLESLRNLPLRAATGAIYRLSQVADINYQQGQTELMRENLRQAVAVTARISGRDLGSTIAAIKAKLGAKVVLPAGMTIEYGGLYQEQQKSFLELLVVLILAVLLVFIVLLIEFRSFSHPISILAGALLALLGVMLALLVTHSTLNVVSLMGVIMVIGIVAKNGILMLDAVEHHLEAGESLNDALVNSGQRRFRPVLMTSFAAILGMSPLALAVGSGAQLLQPLAIVVIGGLAVALLFSLIVTPTIYSMCYRAG